MVNTDHANEAEGKGLSGNVLPTNTLRRGRPCGTFFKEGANRDGMKMRSLPSPDVDAFRILAGFRPDIHSLIITKKPGSVEISSPPLVVFPKDC